MFTFSSYYHKKLLLSFYSIGWMMVVCFLTSATYHVKQEDVKLIVIDAGHGGKDPGCLSASGTKEKDINLDISLRLGKMINKNMPGVKVIYTRRDDRFVELLERAEIANRNHASLFISIHANSGPPGFCGTETYCMGLDKSEQNLEVAQRENASILLEKEHKKKYNNFNPNAPESYILFSLFQNVFLQGSLRLAGHVERHFSDHGRFSRGVKQAGFVVLWKTSMPSVLIETGFLTDPDDEKYLSSKEGREEVAHDIFCAIEAFMND